MPGPRRTASDFARLATEAVHPRATRLDTLAPEAIAALMLSEEAKAIASARTQADAIGRAAQLAADKLGAGGRLVYVGAGTSGRLGTLDAVECVPTFGVPPSRLVAIIAGGPSALTRSVEGAEDNTRDAVALNAISTTAFVLLGKTYAGLMVDVRPTNAKLWARAIRIVRSLSGLDEAAARKLIEKGGGRAKVALVMHHAGVSAARARELLVTHKGSLRAIVGDLPVRAPAEAV